MKRDRILIVDDDPSILRSYEKFLTSEGYSIMTAVNGLEGYDKIEKENPDLVLMDINMPGMTGLELLERLQKEAGSRMPMIIAITAYGDMTAAIKAIQLGAYDFLTKPIPLEKLRLTIKRSFEKIKMSETVAFAVDTAAIEPDAVIGRSSKMVEIYKTIATLSTNKATVLIAGESGTGKEMVAKAIHNMTTNGKESFVPINCAAMPANLIESELLGYVKGSFTGADSNKEGKLAAVGGGTLLLDEITEMPIEFQAKLLRVIQEREYFPVGGTTPKRFDGRIISVTNRDIEKEVSEGRFREDLYYRLNVVTIKMPPLRDHIEDIELLAMHFIKKANFQMHTDIKGITREGIEFLKDNKWPGNIRELENTIIKAAIQAKDSILSRETLGVIQSALPALPAVQANGEDFFFGKLVQLREVEKRYIDFALKNCGWHKGNTAAALGITRPTLDKKIEEYGLTKDV